MATPHNRGDKHAPGTRVRYSNGVEAVVQADGRHRIVSSSAAAAANARKTPRYSRALGPRGAARAFNAYYRNKSYKSPRSKKAAMTRDLCHGRKAKYVRRTTAYKARRNGRLTGPGHYDYPGVDDGSRCPQRGGYESTEEEELFGGYMEGEENEQFAGYMEGEENEQFGAGCRFDSVRGRCLSSPSSRMDGRCEVGPRYMRKGKQMSGRCRKVAAKKSPKKARKSPKKAKKARKSPKKSAKRGRRSKVSKVTGRRSPLMGMKGSACRGLVQNDCAKHPACSWRKRGKAKSPSCGKKKGY